ncbi:MAG: hypothetical protein FWC91_04095 [Defluviitaleaceae bacterium]|nr:hypothetical protein [Defluviitaleaceae bacterium]
MHYIMAMIGSVAFSIGVIVFMVLRSKEKIAVATAISQKSFEQLAVDLKQELADIKEKVSSMEKMMKDVQ